jgi:XXXCH domain-containing protein
MIDLMEEKIMSDSKERSSFVIGMTSQEVSQFLRGIADGIEDKPTEEKLAGIKNFQKLKLKLKRYGEKISVEVKIKQDSSPFQSDDKQDCKQKESGHSSLKKYRAAKKRLKPLFKDIFRSVSHGILPSGDLIQGFFRDSDQMIAFHGQDYYKKYIAACEEFRAALNQGDLAGAKAGCEKIRQIKSECHKKLK